MHMQDQETAILDYYKDHIIRICQGHWCAIEWADRLEEAKYVLLCTMRSPHITEATLWKAYRQTLPGYMTAMNKAENRYKVRLSLDASLPTKNNTKSFSRMDCISAPINKDEKIWRFIASLSEHEQDICEQMMDEKPATRTRLEKELAGGKAELQWMLNAIGEKYIRFDAEYIG